MFVIDDLSVRVAGRLLIEQASVRIAEGARIGFVGRNGSGKSTLFNVITGDVAAEHGNVEFPPRWRLGRLAQEAPNGPENLIDVVLMADVERAKLLERAETETDPHEIAEIHLRLADMGAYAAPARAASILSGLGFSAADQQRPCSEFSGGWRTTVIYTTHYMEEVEALCDEIGVLDNGRLLVTGSLARLLASEGGNSLQLGLTGALSESQRAALSKFAGLEIAAERLRMRQCPLPEFQRLLALLAEQGIAFSSLKYGHGNLEDLFLHLTNRQLRD